MANIGEKGKDYGLILTKKPDKSTTKKITTIFGDDSDEEDSKFKEMKVLDYKKEAYKAKMKKQTQVNLEKALDEDASIFQYDEVYDNISSERNRKVEEEKRKAASAVDKRPRYIKQLMETAADRKLERELLNERKVQAEREAEKEQYADKEAFVTSSYKEKMAELKALQEKRRLEAVAEAHCDVTKQNDLSGFYKYMLVNQTGDAGKSSSTKDVGMTSAKSEKAKKEKPAGESTDSDMGNDSEEEAIAKPEEKVIQKAKPSSKTTNRRAYRRQEKDTSSDSQSDDDSQHVDQSGRTKQDTRRNTEGVHENSSKADRSATNQNNSSDKRDDRKHKSRSPSKEDVKKEDRSRSPPDVDMEEIEPPKKSVPRKKKTKEEEREEKRRALVIKLARRTSALELEAAKIRYNERLRTGQSAPCIEADSD